MTWRGEWHHMQFARMPSPVQERSPAQRRQSQSSCLDSQSERFVPSFSLCSVWSCKFKFFPTWTAAVFFPHIRRGQRQVSTLQPPHKLCRLILLAARTERASSTGWGAMNLSKQTGLWECRYPCCGSRLIVKHRVTSVASLVLRERRALRSHDTDQPQSGELRRDWSEPQHWRWRICRSLVFYI